MFRRRRAKNAPDNVPEDGRSTGTDSESGDATGGWTPEGAPLEDAAAEGRVSAGSASAPAAEPSADEAAGLVTEPAEARPAPVGPPADRSSGPWDISEVDDPTEGGRLNLGGMWLPGAPGMELRVEVDQQSGQVAAVTAVLGQSALQVQPFAAPRTSGIWAEVRADVATGVAEQGGGTREQPGPFGTELHAEIPVQLPDGSRAVQAARFVGVDGPRWFLRGVLTGEAYFDPTAAAALEDVFRGVVVVRGEGPRTRGEPLELTLPVPPEGAVEGGPGDGEASHADESGDGTDETRDTRPPLEPFRRGPEITEVR